MKYSGGKVTPVWRIEAFNPLPLGLCSIPLNCGRSMYGDSSFPYIYIKYEFKLSDHHKEVMALKHEIEL